MSSWHKKVCDGNMTPPPGSYRQPRVKQRLLHHNVSCSTHCCWRLRNGRPQPWPDEDLRGLWTFEISKRELSSSVWRAPPNLNRVWEMPRRNGGRRSRLQTTPNKLASRDYPEAARVWGNSQVSLHPDAADETASSQFHEPTPYRSNPPVWM